MSVIAQKYQYKWFVPDNAGRYVCPACGKIVSDADGNPIKGAKMNIWTLDLYCPRCYTKVGLASPSNKLNS